MSARLMLSPVKTARGASNYTYASIGEMMAAADKLPAFANSAAGDRLASRTNGTSREWDFGVGWTGAIELAREGWPEGRKRVAEVADKMREEVLQDSRELEAPAFVHGVAGAYVDVPAYLAHDPECMVAWVPVAQERPIVRLYVSIGGSAGIDSGAFKRRGAAAAALVDLLEMTGRRCEVIACADTRQGPGIRLVVKRPEHPLDMDSVAFWLAHPAAFRRMFFAMMEHMSAEDRGKAGVPRGSYGSPGEAHPDEYGDAVYIPNMSLHDRNTFGLKWLRDRLAEQGVTLGDAGS